MLLCNTWGARARLRQWQASRRWSQAYIPNRHAAPLQPVEALAESGSAKTRAAAALTGNWTLLRCLEALAEDSRQRRRKTG